MNLLIESPIQTKEKFAESSGLKKRAIDALIKEGVIPVEKYGERTTLINVALYATQLLKAEKVDTKA